MGIQIWELSVQLNSKLCFKEVITIFKIDFIDLANMYRLLKPITSAQQTLLDEVQAHIKTQGLDAISGLKGDTVRQLQFIRIYH